MTAAAIAPTVVQEIKFSSDLEYGTSELRLKKYIIQLTKAAQNDWVVIDSTYGIEGQLILAKGFVFDGSTDGAVETLTYTHSGTKLVMAGSGTGTEYIEILMKV